MIDQLITALSQEVEMSAEEIADTIWLALQMQEFQPESVFSGLPLTTEDQGKINQKKSQPQATLPEPQPKTSESEETQNQSPEEQKAGIYPRNEQQTSKYSNLSIKVPDAPSLREPLTLARALKPLMRRIPSGRELVLDEAATIQRIAVERLWIPVLKPTVEPWLDLELVVDEAISMQIWRHTIKELERLLKNYGIFRDVRVWGLITDENEQVQIRRGIGAAAKNQTPRSPKELIDPTGRRLVLVVSDCVSSLWRNGELTPVLELWAKQGSMAIIQMLPKWLWKRTALGRASEVRLRGLTPGVFNQNLIAKEVSLWDELDEEMGVKVPVFTLEPDKVATWAQMLSGKGSIWTLGYVFKLDASVKKERELFNLNHSNLSAEQRVQAFRVTASPMARKLAGLLASAPVINLPIVRLIREAMLKDSQQVHVAEVFLGRLLKPLSEINADTNPDYVQYEFMDGVRELLVDSVPSQYVLNVVDEVSKYVAKKVGLSLEDFAAVLRNPQEVRDSGIVEEVGYFATVTAQVLRRLGGDYVSVANSLNNNIANKKEIIELVHLLENTPYEFTRRNIIDDLEKIAVGNEIAIAALINILKVTKDEKTRWKVADSLKKIAVGNEMAIAALINIIETTVYDKLLRVATKILKKIAVENEMAIKTLFIIVRTNKNEFVCDRAVEILEVITVDNEAAISSLKRLLLSKQIDYTHLRHLLIEKKWKEADEETARLMFKIADREKERWLRIQDIDQFPSIDLRNLDQLWIKYSHGRFGFSVQKQIYQSLGGTKNFNREITEAFWKRVGLLVNNQPYWSQYNNLMFNLSAPVGHLPIKYDVETPSGVLGVIESLLSRSDLVLNGTVFVSVNEQDKRVIVPIVKNFLKLGFKIAATSGTYRVLQSNGIKEIELILKLHEGRPHVIDGLKYNRIHLIIATPSCKTLQTDEKEFYHRVLEYNIPVITSITEAENTVEIIRLAKLHFSDLKNRSTKLLKSFIFEIPTVNGKGEMIKNETKQAQYYIEKLPNNILLEMVAIPGGKFMMGSPQGEGNEREKPQHEVTVQPFFMSKYPVTQVQWRAVADLPKINQDLNSDPSSYKDDHRPVERVSWDEAVEFCDRLSTYTGRQYRLPSEAEWEYACRAGTTTPFCFGETITGELANYYAEKSFADEPPGKYRGQSTPVGNFPPNAFGLYDMHGNVQEWCLDIWHSNYENAPTDGREWNEKNANKNKGRVIRGGAFTYFPEDCRSAFRSNDLPLVSRHYVGFRVVCVSETN